MEENTKSMEALLERATEYGKSSYELVRLKTIDKASEVVSSCAPHVFGLILILIFLLFLNLGLSLWLGEVLGKAYYGFFAVASFYFVVWAIVRIFMHKWLKGLIKNNIIKQLLN